MSWWGTSWLAISSIGLLFARLNPPKDPPINQRNGDYENNGKGDISSVVTKLVSAYFPSPPFRCN